jgi:hypothetical protein
MLRDLVRASEQPAVGSDSGQEKVDEALIDQPGGWS